MRNVSRVDDLVFPVVTPARQFSTNVQLAMKVVVWTFIKFNLTLNAAMGKTNATVRFAGTGALSVQKQLEALNFVVLCRMADGSISPLHFAEAYRHLRMTTPPDLSLNADQTARYGAKRAALKPTAKKCFRVEGVPVADKCEISRGLLLSVGLFGSSTCHLPTLCERQRSHTNVMCVYRPATASHHAEFSVPISDQALIEQN